MCLLVSITSNYTINGFINTNPTQFWKTLDALKNSERERILPSKNIETDDWLNHCKTLASKTIEINEEQKILMKELYSLRQSEITDSQALLEKPITIHELKQTIKSMRNNKTPGNGDK